jgi:non-lysosomal glucosylceramidase
MSQAGGVALVAAVPAGVREFLAAHFSGVGQAALVPADKGFDPAWVTGLTARGVPDVAKGEELSYIGMPVGGLCCGQVYLAGDGRLWHWDVFHQLGGGNGGGPHYAKPMPVESPISQGFQIEIGGERHELRAGDDLDVEFETRYPIGVVRYGHPKLGIELQAFSPFIPLETDDSSMPLTVMRYTLTNPTSQTVSGTLSGWLKNPVGDFLGQSARMSKRQSTESSPGFTLLECFAEPNDEATKDRRSDIDYEEFEGDSYAPWTVEGDAFGTRPFRYDELPDRKKPIVPHGKSFVNSHESRHGEDSEKADSYVGKLTSPEFTVSRRYVNFFIGGGNHPGLECINLVIGGKVVRSETGRDANPMRAAFFDTAELQGQTAHLEIVDNFRGGWGHITVDSIVFSDTAAADIPVEQLADFGSMCLGVLEHGTVDEQSVGVEFSLRPNEKRTITFFLTWFFPNLTDAEPFLGRLEEFPKIKRHYARRYRSARDVARDFQARSAHLVGKTMDFAETWYDSSLPHWFLARTLIPVDCLATATSYRFDDDRFYAWEGVYCCAGTCQHVWNYAQASARLFPELERHTREFTDYGIAYQPDGTLFYRAEYDHRMAHDGQAGTIIRTFREHTMTPDTKWIERIWPRVKNSIRRLMKEDSNHDGILDTWQYNTLDDAWAGKISWISSMYLASLRCGAEMARDLGDLEFAQELEARVAKGAVSVMDQLYDGEIFVMKRDPAHPESVGTGPGCHIDQVFGDSLLHQVGLDPVLPRPAVRGALKALFKYNFAPNAGDYRNRMQAVLRGGRWYAMPGEAGLLMTTFPKGGAIESQGKGRNSVFVGYFNECMNGFEYQAAAHMIAESLLTEGLAVVRTLHKRYGPSKRNPYNEIECSDHYARSMASYGAFLTMCGFRWYGPRRHLAFAPKLPGDFRAPFVTGDGWGTVSLDNGRAELKVRHGRLRVKTLDVPLKSAGKVTLDGRAVAMETRLTDSGVQVTFDRDLVVKEGSSLSVG